MESFLRQTARPEIKRWLLELGLDGVDDSNVDEIVDNPRGVLVGPEFDPDAILEAEKSSPRLQGVRLTRFKAESRSEYYVIIEDQIGDVINPPKRIGWQPFIDKGLIEPSDIFSIMTREGVELCCARPDPESFGTRSKKFIFEDESASKILEREEHIRNNATESPKWLDTVIQSIKNKRGVLITHATGIVYLAFEWPAAYWVPGQYWIHKKSNKSLDQLKYQLDR